MLKPAREMQFQKEKNRCEQGETPVRKFETREAESYVAKEVGWGREVCGLSQKKDKDKNVITDPRCIPNESIGRGVRLKQGEDSRAEQSQ